MTDVLVRFIVSGKFQEVHTTSPLEGAVVAVFSGDGETRVTRVETDGDGVAETLLPAGEAYQIRLFKIGWQFPSNLQLTLDPAEAEPVEVEALGEYLEEFPPSMYEDLCSVGAVLRGSDMAPRRGVVVTALPAEGPMLVQGQAVLDLPVRAVSGSFGAVSMDLIRGGIYDLEVVGLASRRVRVPYEPRVNLLNLLYPRILEAALPTSLTVKVGTKLQLPLSSVLTSKNQLPFQWEDGSWETFTKYVRWSLAGHTATVTYGREGNDEYLLLEGRFVGVSVLSLERREQDNVQVTSTGDLPELPTTVINVVP